MTHAALVNGTLFWFVVLLTLLLVLLCARWSWRGRKMPIPPKRPRSNRSR
jgi:uncharacterized iron-regulated membrane protein